MTTRPTNNARSQLIAKRVRMLRKARGWSAAHLADQLVGAGITQQIIANLDRQDRDRTRHISVDELFAFAEVLGVSALDLASLGPVCTTCRDEPPTGFACLTCGAAA